jgi:hypothetical protein
MRITIPGAVTGLLMMAVHTAVHTSVLGIEPRTFHITELHLSFSLEFYTRSSR